MSNITKKILAIVTALTISLTMAGPAFGATVAELQAQINALLAQISALQTQLATLQGQPTVTGCTITTFDRNLKQGMSGDDVKCLQIILNSSADTQVAATGTGSPGNETSYFGPLTKAAVVKFQKKYASEVLASYGLTTGTGFVGSTTRAKLNTLLGAAPVTPVTGAGLTVALAADNPAAGTVVAGQAIAPLAKLTFTNGDSTEVKVTGLKLKRLGISADASLTNIYLFDGATRLTDGASVSSGVITFSLSGGIFTVPAGGSKTITVVSDICSTTTCSTITGETMGVGLNAASDVTTNASSVKGTFPLNGNLMSVAASTLAGVNFAASTTPSDASIDPQNDYVVWQNLSVVTNRAVNMTRISFRKTGSVAINDLQNFRLYVAGVQVGSTIANLDANGYVTFDLTASPKKLETGTKEIKLVADIIGGSSLTFQFHLWSAADVTFIDTQYGVNILPQANSTTFSKRSAGTNGMTVNSGVITITKLTDSPSSDLVDGAANATLAKFQVKAAGEKVKIETLKVAVVCTNCTSVSYLRNGMLLANGVQIGSTSNLYINTYSTSYTSFSLGSSLIVEPSTPVTLEVRSDIYDNDGTNNIVSTAGSETTLKARIVGSTSENNATGMVSAATIDAPSANVDGNTLTVKKGGLTLSKYTAYTNQAPTPPLTAYKLAHFTLTAKTTEAVNITTIEANLNNVVSSYASNLYVKFGNDTTTVKPAISAVSNSWSVNYTLAAGETKDLIVYADISSSAAGTGYVGAYVAGTTVSSANSVTAGTSATPTDVQGQSIVFTTGTFTPAVDGTTPLSQIVAGGQQVVAGKFKFTTRYDSYTIKELRFTIGTAADSSAINSAIVKDGDTTLATVSYDSTNSYFNITGLNVSVAANTSKVLSLVYNLSSTISSDSGNSQVDLKPTLSYVKYATSQGTESCIGTGCTDTTTYATGKYLYVFRSIPTVTKDTTITGTGVSLAGTPTINLYGWKVTADAKGPVAVKQVKFDLALSDAGNDSTLYLYGFKLYKNDNDISSLATITDEDGHNLQTTTAANGANENSTKIIVYWTTEDTVAAGTMATYKLTAIASGFITNSTTKVAGDDTISVSMPADTTVNSGKYIVKEATAPGDFIELASSTGTCDTTAANFIWSDNSAVSHLYTTATEGSNATSSADWANGYLVQSLPLSTTSFVGP